MEVEVSSGFLVVKTFERMYREYPVNIELYQQAYNEILHPVPLEQMPGKYRGIDRDPIQPWVEGLRGSGIVEPTEHELAASLFMDELTESGKAYDDFIFTLDDARKLLEMIPPPVEREIIWTRRIDKADPPPPETVLLGYDPTSFYAGEHESLIAGEAFFRYLRIADIDDPEDRERASIHHARLNKWGLFDTPAHAKEYINSFPLMPRHELPNYIAEIRAVA